MSTHKEYRNRKRIVQNEKKRLIKERLRKAKGSQAMHKLDRKKRKGIIV